MRREPGLWKSSSGGVGVLGQGEFPHVLMKRQGLFNKHKLISRMLAISDFLAVTSTKLTKVGVFKTDLLRNCRR